MKVTPFLLVKTCKFCSFFIGYLMNMNSSTNIHVIVCDGSRVDLKHIYIYVKKNKVV